MNCSLVDFLFGLDQSHRFIQQEGLQGPILEERRRGDVRRAGLLQQGGGQRQHQLQRQVGTQTATDTDRCMSMCVCVCVHVCVCVCLCVCVYLYVCVSLQTLP